MTIQGRARTPGPLGSLGGSLNGNQGRSPGPVGNTLWDKQTTKAPPPATRPAVKKTVMPAPTNDQDSKDVHVITWALFGSKKSPTFDEVKQAPGLANCPVAAILAALAFTASGRALLQKMVKETKAATLTDLAGLDKDTLSNPPAGMKLSSSRYFTVALPRGAVEVSDVLYTDDHSAGWSPLYMRDPHEHSLWAPIIEKALAVQLDNSYENFDALPLTANDFWEKITGTKPGGFAVDSKTPGDKIMEAARASVRVSSIGASKDSGTRFVSEFHGHAMLGLDGSRIRLYDPAKAKTLSLTLAQFQQDFQAILSQK
jgi:hypothetical protein